MPARDNRSSRHHLFKSDFFLKADCKVCKSQEWYCSCPPPPPPAEAVLRQHMPAGRSVFYPNSTYLGSNLDTKAGSLENKVEKENCKAQSRTNETWWHFTTFFFHLLLQLLSLTSFYGDENISPFMASLYFINEVNAIVSTESPISAKVQITNSSDHSNTKALSC